MSFSDSTLHSSKRLDSISSDESLNSSSSNETIYLVLSVQDILLRSSKVKTVPSLLLCAIFDLGNCNKFKFLGK